MTAAEVHGWGRYPRALAEVLEPRAPVEAIRALEAGVPLLARGMGRSYGDSAIAPRLLATCRLDRFRSFDPATGEIACEAGVSLDDILRVALPHGWFLPVTPGTRFVSVGGAIASDVHGKDHHVHGSFGRHVQQMELLLGNGEVVKVSAQENAPLFHATCGGMGLTGVILAATLRLRRVPSGDILQTTVKLPGLQALLEALDAEAASTYSVAWIDCSARGTGLGRALLMLGEHAADGPLAPPGPASLAVPFDLPRAAMNACVARAFNALYYGRAPAARSVARVGLRPFFYPLDALRHWNRLHGRGGFVQYQFVVPRAGGALALAEVLRRIASAGVPSFLGVLKQMGPAAAGPLSFPLAGYTLAVDFRAEPAVFRLLDELDAVVLAHGGRLYLAKDARMSERTFRRCYPRWQEFEQVRAVAHAHGHFASAQSRRLGLA